mgnify:FL=1
MMHQYKNRYLLPVLTPLISMDRIEIDDLLKKIV